MPSRKDYISWIHTYENRRKNVKNHCEQKIAKEKAAIRNMGKKIKLWRREIKRIDERNKKIRQIAKMIEEFSGINVKKSARSNKQFPRMIRMMFYKLCLEQKLQAKLVGEFMGVQGSNIARARRVFNGKLTTKSEEKELWDRFRSWKSSLNDI
jgi:hypothetical protein